MRRLFLFVSGLLLVAGLLLMTLGRSAYRGYKERRAASRAAEFLNKSDFPNAAICARQALALNHSNLAACEIMAGLAERAGVPQVLDWRRRIAEVDPSVENRFRLAAAALKVEPPPWTNAAATLRGLAPEGSNRAFFHVLSAELALKRNQPWRAEEHFGEASRLEPGNSLHMLNGAVLRLSSTNSVVAASARATLEHFAEDTNVAPLALRWLIGDSLRRKDLPVAERFSDRLVIDGRSGLDDRLQHLDVLRQAESRNFQGFLNATQQGAGSNAVAVQRVAAWMLGVGLSADAFHWLTNLPIQVRTQQPVSVALADCLMALKEWRGLQSFLERESWGDADFMRLALLSRAALAQGQQVGADGHWRLAVRAAGDRLGPLTMLAGLAGKWGRDKAREDLLWQIARTFPREQWVWAQLDRVYTEAGNTRGLHKLYSALVAFPRPDPIAQNNLAATSMLLNSNLEKAFEIARQLNAQRPDDPVIVSTHAFSLHLQGRTGEGLAALERLSPEALDQGSVALYYGVLLAADGQQAKAVPRLDQAGRSRLLPEEKLMLEKARVVNRETQ